MRGARDVERVSAKKNNIEPSWQTKAAEEDGISKCQIVLPLSPWDWHYCRIGRLLSHVLGGILLRIIKVRQKNCETARGAIFGKE